jgi:alcohol dehydrogenase class IV
MRFDSPKTILHGGGCRHDLHTVMGGGRVLLVTDAFVERSGVAAELAGQLSQRVGAEVRIFADVQPDPTDVNVRDGCTAFGEFGADTILAVGGGSPMDCAKAIRWENPQAALIAVPTTAGTGSEATKVMVITDTAQRIKRMTADARLMPDVAVVDFELSMTMPRPLTAHVGVDTLTHGLEAFVSRKRNAMSDVMARSCLELCGRHLRRAWQEGTDREARAGMALAALHGGMAFTNASVGLVHGMSRPIGALFHVPHGLSNAVLLPTVTRFSWEGAVEAYREAAGILGAPEERDGFVAWLMELNRELEVPRLRECCGNDEQRFEKALEKMAGDAIASGSPGNNPRVPEVTEIVALYREAW